MAFTKRASSGKGKLIYPHIPPNTAATKNPKTTDNNLTQATLKVSCTLGGGRPRWILSDQSVQSRNDSHPKAAFARCFPPAATLTTKPDKLVHCPDVSYRRPVAVALCWPPTHWADVSVPCSLHQPLLHPQVLSCIPFPGKSTCVPSSRQESVVNQKALNPQNHIRYASVIPTQTAKWGTTKAVWSDLPVNNVSSRWDNWLSIRTSLNFNWVPSA